MLTITCYCYESFYYLNIILNLNENRNLINNDIHLYKFQTKIMIFYRKNNISTS